MTQADLLLRPEPAVRQRSIVEAGGHGPGTRASRRFTAGRRDARRGPGAAEFHSQVRQAAATGPGLDTGARRRRDSGSGLCLRAESLCRRDRRRVHSGRHCVDRAESDAYVAALHVTDNSTFSAGQLLVELDPRDFQVAVAIATANLQSAQAAQAVAEARLSEQSKVIAADEANVQGDRGTLTFAEQQLTRFTALAKTGAGTIESSQQAQSDLTERQAALQRDIATLAAASGQVDVLRGQARAGKGQCCPGAGGAPPGGTQSVVHEDLCAIGRERSPTGACRSAISSSRPDVVLSGS